MKPMPLYIMRKSYGQAKKMIHETHTKFSQHYTKTIIINILYYNICLVKQKHNEPITCPKTTKFRKTSG